MSLVFAVERMRDVVEEIKPLNLAHWNEREDIRPAGEFNPDYERGLALNESGALILVTARRGTELIGYCSCVLNTDMWTSQRYASADLLYVIPQERGGFIGVRLFEYAHEVLKYLGIREVRALSGANNRMVSLLIHSGYHLTGKQQFMRSL